MLGRTYRRGTLDDRDGVEDDQPESRSARLEAALDAIAEAIVICDEEGDPVFYNSAARRLLSARPSDALVMQAVEDAISSALSGGQPERRLDLISPGRKSLSVRAVQISAAGGVDGALAVIEDVSERLRLEAVRRDFVANVSHELKTPIGALTLLAETIDGETDAEVMRRLALRMGGEAERLSRIVDDLLDLSRIEGDGTVDRAEVSVAEILAEAVEGLRTVAAGLEVVIDLRPVAKELVVNGDRRDLVSAVANLVDNAVKYSEPGGVVTVRASEEDGYAYITVTDRGVGIPARDLERIFERFYRVDRARSRTTGGTGLGLSIVRNVAANHGGSVRVESVEGEGSTFVLALPARGGPVGGRVIDEEDQQ